MNDSSESPSDAEPPTIPPIADDPTLPPTNDVDDATIPPGDGRSGELDTLAESQTAWRPGGKIQYFGDYELINEIARGGMGVVYRAKQTSLNRIVALKMILAGQLAGDEEVQRFHAEAEAAANLDHPGIVPIYEVGEVEGQHYFSMGYVDGSSLSELIAENPLPPDEAAELMVKVAEAIAYAHDRGVIHRDLKPANVLVQQRIEGSGSGVTGPPSNHSGSGSSVLGLSPRVTDFGLAKQVQGDDQLTASGQILGTPSYMPPEQASGKIDQIDHRADVYSLGGILYALVTGRPPFQAANQLDTLMQVLEKDPVPPRQLDPNIPKDLETIALKALEKDPERRYQTANEFCEDLTRFLTGEPIKARSITSIERAWRWARRKPVVAGLGSLAVLLLLIVSIGGPLAAVQQANLADIAEEKEDAARRAQRAAELATEAESAAKQEAIDANEALGKEKERAERTLYARTVSLAYQAWKNNDAARAEDLLNSANHRYRGWEWDYVKGLCHSEIKTLRGHSGIPFRIRLTPDGKRMVSIGRVHGVNVLDANVYLWDLDTGAVTKKLARRAYAISPDARLVAFEKVSDGPVILYDLENESEITSIPAHAGGTTWANFNSDGSRLVTNGPDKAIRIWDVATGEQVLEIRDENRKIVHDVNVSADDKLLYWKRFDGVIQIYDAESGKKLTDIEDRMYGKEAVGVTMSPDNQILAAASSGPIHLFEVSSGEKIGSLYGHAGNVLDLSFSPDGKRLASAGADRTVRVWDVAEQRESFRLRGHQHGTMYGVWEVTYSRDGKWILTGGADTTIKIWPADGGDGFLRDEMLANAEDVDAVQAAAVYPDPSQESDWLIGNLDYVEAVAFSEDGKRIATAGKDSHLRVYDVDSRERLEEFDHDHALGAVALSRDGKRLAVGEGGINDNRSGRLFIRYLDEDKLQVITWHSGPISKLIFDDTGEVLFSATGSQRVAHRGQIVAWKYAEDDSVFVYEDIAGVTDMALSPDGSMLVAGAWNGPPHLIDTSNGKLIRKLDMDDDIAASVAFSPDGRTIATGSRSAAVSLWDVQSGTRIWKEVDHTEIVTGIKFDPSGKRIFSTGTDGSIRIWDAETGDKIVDLKDKAMQMFDLAVSPDGSTIAAFGEAPYVTLKSIDSEAGPELIGGPAIEEEEAWPVIFADDFDREKLSDRWTVVNDRWEIEDGAAKGTLELMPSVPIPNFAANTMIPKTWLPSIVEIEYEVWAPEPAVFECKLSDEANQNAIDGLFVAMNQPFFNRTVPGGALVLQSVGQFGETARTGEQTWFTANQKHKLKTIRRRGSWEMFVDGKPLLQAEVPESMWVPALQVQCSFAAPGSTVYVDNLVIRAPESVADEITATNVEYDLRQVLKLKDLVIAAIEEDSDLSESVRKLALRFARSRRETPKERKQLTREILMEEQEAFTAYAPLIELLKQEIDGTDDDWQNHQFLAIAHYRSNDLDAALEALRSAEQEYQKSFAMSHPIHMALLVLISDQKDDPTRTEVALGRLTELMRSDHWKSDEEAVAWRDRAVESISRPAPDDPVLAKQEEAIKHITFEPLQQSLVRFKNDEYYSVYTDDAIHIEGRTGQPNEYDVEVKHPRWVEAQRLFHTGAPSLHGSLVRSRVGVEITGDEATLTGQYTGTLDFAHWRWDAEVRLRKIEGSWKIYWERRGITGFRMRTERHVQSPSDWARLDQQVEAARETGDKMKLLRALANAFRRQEAFEVMQQVVDQSDNPPASHWTGLADRAYSVFDADVMLEAVKKAIEIDPAVPGAPFVRALAVTENLPEPQEIGEGISVRTPEFVPVANSRDFFVPGKVLQAWYPSNRSALVAFFAKDGHDKPIREGIDDLTDGLKAQLKIIVHRKEIRELDGKEATDLIIEGAGNGRGLTKVFEQVEPKGTIMRWVVTHRGSDLIGFLLVAPSNEFDARNSEFETWLKHVNLQVTPNTEGLD